MVYVPDRSEERNHKHGADYDLPVQRRSRIDVTARAVHLVGNLCPSYLRAFSADLSARLQSGSHLILCGPRGSGKSTLVASMRDYYRSQLVPCAIAPQTSGLSDVITALSRAYPEVGLEALNRRAVGVRLRLAANRLSGVLLRDHTREVTTAMIGFLRRLRVARHRSQNAARHHSRGPRPYRVAK